MTLEDQRRRNAVEGKIGQGKRRYGLNLIREKLPVTSGSTIAINVLVMNLEKLLELLFVVFRVLLLWIKGQLDAWRVARMSPSMPGVVAVA